LSRTLRIGAQELGEAGNPIACGPIERRVGAAIFVSGPDGIRVELQIRNAG
jgi:hypothetical protein